MTTRLPLLLVVGLTLAVPVAAEEGATSSGRGPATFDARAPVPLTPMMAEHQKRNMREHLAAVQEIVAALAADDLAAARAAARKIGFSDAMAQMCQHMGAGAPGFTDMALAFHRTADTIGDAADRGDAKGALRALTDTLGKCVGCHAAFRQEVVDEDTWRRVTAPPEAGKTK